MAASLAKKLQLKPGQRALVLNSPDGYAALLRPLPAAVRIEERAGEGEYDFVHLFVKDQDELAEHAPVALDSVKDDGLLWISYPKKSSGVDSDISRDEGWGLLDEAGYQPVSQVAVDDVWSALRFRPKERVGT